MTAWISLIRMAAATMPDRRMCSVNVGGVGHLHRTVPKRRTGSTRTIPTRPQVRVDALVEVDERADWRRGGSRESVYPGPIVNVVWDIQPDGAGGFLIGTRHQ